MLLEQNDEKVLLEEREVFFVEREVVFEEQGEEETQG